MLDVYLTVLNMSITAGIAALIIMILRASLGKVLPRAFSYAIWAIVLYRMICIVSFSSIFSIPGRIQSGLNTYTYSLKAASLTETLDFKILSVHNAQEFGLTPNLLQDAPTEATGGVVPMQLTSAPISTDYFAVAITMLWVLGIFALLLYNTVSYRRLCKSINTSIFLRIAS